VALYKNKGGGGGSPGAAYYLALAASRIGISSTDKNFGFIFEDFDKSSSLTAANGWINGVTGSASLSARVASTKGGVVQLTTSGSAGDRIDITSLEILVSALGTDKWWFAGRFKLTTAPFAGQTQAAVGLFNSTGNSISIGEFAGNVNYRLQYDGALPAGSFLDMGVAVDTAFHVGEFYSKGDNKLYTRFDEGSELNVTPSSNPTTGMYMICSVGNGTNAAVQTNQVDFVSCLYPR
jgi:hypothetical protein